MPTPELIIPDWPAPERVRAFISTRVGGVSKEPFAELNLGDHVGDNPEHVSQNRALFAERCGVDAGRIAWLKQVHGVTVSDAANLISAGGVVEADASFTSQANTACVIMTADCLPVLFCDRSATRVAAAHAGWRGLAAGVLQSTLAQFDRPDEVMAFFGPAISKAHFEVGSEVKTHFVSLDSDYASAFVPSTDTKFMCDLYAIARTLLSKHGVKQIFGGDHCTYAEEQRFYSYRRDGAHSGRMASLIYLKD